MASIFKMRVPAGALAFAAVALLARVDAQAAKNAEVSSQPLVEVHGLRAAVE